MKKSAPASARGNAASVCRGWWRPHRAWRWAARFTALAVAAVLLVATSPARALELPKGLAVPGSLASASPPGTASSQPSADEWRNRLAQAREAHERLARHPPDSEPLLAERQLTSSRLLTLLVSQIEATREPAGDSPAAATTPIRLADAAPYSVLDVDALRDRLDDLRAQRAALQLSLASQHDEVEDVSPAAPPPTPCSASGVTRPAG